MTSANERLLSRVRDVGCLQSVAMLLDWDQETVMPKNGVAARAQQQAMVAGLAHETLVSDDMRRMLEEARFDRDDFVGQTNLRETRRSFERARRVPTELVKKLAHATTVAKDAWADARKADRFADFAPHLETLITLKKQVAECIGYTTEPYDALMDEFEPDARAADVARLFAELRAVTVELLKKTAGAKKKPDPAILRGTFPKDLQAALCQETARAINFDFGSGYLAESVHPFCNTVGGPGDVRITTRYHEDDAVSAIFSVLHEVGHALYEQGLPAEHRFTPMGSAVSMGIHESQSRMWENFVGRSKAYWKHHFPALQKAFPEPFRGLTLEQFHGAINWVEPSFIRVEADELTYNLHIILRFELERGLFKGELGVKEIPAAWNEQMKKLLGITPPTNREGCLQDIHWSIAGFGYFPTYTLGNLYAAQFFEKAQQDIPDLWKRIEANDHRPLLDWLRKNIHQHGQRYRAGELVDRVTGKALSIEAFKRYVTGKFGEIYGF